ncbi:MAG: ankyrin repeat domain-containing protein [bacterium]
MHKTIIQQLIRGMVIAGLMAGGMMAQDADAGAEGCAGAGAGAGGVLVAGRIEVDLEDADALFDAVIADNRGAFRSVLDPKSPAERTALVYADVLACGSLLSTVVCGDKVQCLELLIEYGIDVNRRFVNRELPGMLAEPRLPISLAAEYGCVGVMEVLHKHGADLNGVDSRGFPPLLLALANLQIETHQWLLDNGCAFISIRPKEEHPIWEDLHNLIKIFYARRRSEGRSHEELLARLNLISANHHEVYLRGTRWSLLRRAWCGVVARGVFARKAQQAATGAPAGKAPAAGRAKRPRGHRYVTKS